MVRVLHLLCPHLWAWNSQHHNFEKEWGLGRCWRFLTVVWYLDLYLDIFTGLCYTHVLSFGTLSWFWRILKKLSVLLPCENPFLFKIIVLWTSSSQMRTQQMQYSDQISTNLIQTKYFLNIFNPKLIIAKLSLLVFILLRLLKD